MTATDNDQDLQYHVGRARAELDLAYRAEHRSAAEAHMRLSALHMGRARLSGATLVMKVEQR